MIKEKEFKKVWRIFQRKRKDIYKEWRDKEECLNLWFNEQIKK